MTGKEHSNSILKVKTKNEKLSIFEKLCKRSNSMQEIIVVKESKKNQIQND